jgi:hypothetical protein
MQDIQHKIDKEGGRGGKYMYGICSITWHYSRENEEQLEQHQGPWNNKK